jgi:hypothetical protein
MRNGDRKLISNGSGRGQPRDSAYPAAKRNPSQLATERGEHLRQHFVSVAIDLVHALADQ